MRWFALAAAIGVFAVGLPYIIDAHATGNVLVPRDDSRTSSGLPNLGLMPAPSPTDTPSGTTPTKEGNDSKEESVSSHKDTSPTTILPSLSSPNSTSGGYTPMPSAPVQQTTQIIKMPDADTGNPADARLPNSLNVELADKFNWGEQDIAAISSQLGIDPQQISQHCRLSVGGILMTDKGVQLFDMGSASQTTVRYEGAPSSANVRVQALCDMLPLPSGTAIAFQLGDKYAVSLSQVTCPKLSGSRRLVFHYSGDGNGECL